MPRTLHKDFSTEIAEARASIHERRFLPILADINDQVNSRRLLVPTVTTLEILTELSIDARVKEAIEALSERVKLDRSYKRTVGLCWWVALPWLVSVISSLMLFYVYFHSSVGVRYSLINSLWGVLIVSVLVGSLTLFLFLKSRNTLVWIIGANRF